MAKQVGSYRITGTIDDICFYIREGEYLARSKSSLDRKRYKNDPAFEGSRRSNDRMAKASTLASKLYKFLDKTKKGRQVFNKLVGQIKLKIKKGWDKKDVEIWFNKEYLGQSIKTNTTERMKTRFDRVNCFVKLDIAHYKHKKKIQRRIIKIYKNKSRIPKHKFTYWNPPNPKLQTIRSLPNNSTP